MNIAAESSPFEGMVFRSDFAKFGSGSIRLVSPCHCDSAASRERSVAGSEAISLAQIALPRFARNRLRSAQ